MNILIENPESEDTIVLAKVDKELSRHRMALATPRTIKGRFGQILTQYIAFDDYIIWHHVFSIKNPVCIRVYEYDSGIPLVFALKGSIPPVGCNEDADHISEGQCIIAPFAPILEKKMLDPGEYEIFQLEIGENYKSELLNTFPILNTTFPLNRKTKRKITIPLKALLRIQSILKNEHEELIGKMHIDLEIKQILIYTFEEFSKETINGFLLPMRERQRLEAVRSYIVNNLAGKLTIDQLGKKFGMARTSLKLNFRGLYHQTIHTYIIEKKMEMAKLLLEQGESISSIAEKVGYPEPANFIRGFKQQTGFTPSSYRESIARPN